MLCLTGGGSRDFVICKCVVETKLRYGSCPRCTIYQAYHTNHIKTSAFARLLPLQLLLRIYSTL